MPSDKELKELAELKNKIQILEKKLEDKKPIAVNNTEAKINKKSLVRRII